MSDVKKKKTIPAILTIQAIQVEKEQVESDSNEDDSNKVINKDSVGRGQHIFPRNSAIFESESKVSRVVGGQD